MNKPATHPPQHIDALHDLANSFELKAINSALNAGDALRGKHVFDRVHAKALEDEALRRFQLADHIRKSATRLQVAQVTGD